MIQRFISWLRFACFQERARPHRYATLTCESLEQRLVLAKGQFNLALEGMDTLRIDADPDENSLTLTATTTSNDPVLRPTAIDTFRWDELPLEEQQRIDDVTKETFITTQRKEVVAAVQITKLIVNLDGEVQSAGKADSFRLAGNWHVLFPNLRSVVIRGGGGDDAIQTVGRPLNVAATEFQVQIYGDDGDDTIDSNGGDITVVGGKGDDHITVNSAAKALVYGDLDGVDKNAPTIQGNDRIFVFADNNAVWGGAGNDEIYGSDNPTATNVLHGGHGRDMLYGGSDGPCRLTPKERGHPDCHKQVEQLAA